jgi:hypothetical protein
MSKQSELALAPRTRPPERDDALGATVDGAMRSRNDVAV